MKIFNLFLLTLLTMTSLYSQDNNDKINALYTCSKSYFIGTINSDTKRIVEKEFFYKNLEIHFSNLDFDIGVGEILITDNDRNNQFYFKVKTIDRKKCGFFKNDNNEEYALYTFEANVDGRNDESLVKIISFVESKKWNLIIESNKLIEGHWVKIYEIYEDIIKVKDL